MLAIELPSAEPLLIVMACCLLAPLTNGRDNVSTAVFPLVSEQSLISSAPADIEPNPPPPGITQKDICW